MQEDVSYDADFLRWLQIPSGAIFSDVTRSRVEPYVGNHAAWGLARAARFTGDPTYLHAARKWLSWYQSHMGADGIVHEYVVTKRGTLRSSDDHDSVDATNGVFLLAMREAYWATPRWNRPSQLDKYGPAIAAAVRAIESLRDVDGLTWAKPSWRVKYLMDNSEAYAGLVAGRELATAMGDEALRQAAVDGLSRARSGLRTLWNPDTGAYDWAEHSDGFRQPTNWDVLYPDAVEQAWSVAFRFAPESVSGELMARFLEAQPNWDRPTAMATYWDGDPYPHTVDFWPVAGFAFANVGDVDRAAAGAAHIREGAWEINRQAPFTTGAQGQLIVLQTGGLSMQSSP